MHRPFEVSSTHLVHFIFTAIVLTSPQITLAANNTHADPDQVTLTLMAQEIQPIELFRGIERG
jgi:hypothetical protein